MFFVDDMHNNHIHEISSKITGLMESHQHSTEQYGLQTKPNTGTK